MRVREPAVFALILGSLTIGAGLGPGVRAAGSGPARRPDDPGLPGPATPTGCTAGSSKGSSRPTTGSGSGPRYREEYLYMLGLSTRCPSRRP